VGLSRSREFVIHSKSIVINSCLTAFMVTACIGCGGASGPHEKLVEASGLVKLDGKPTSGIRLSFLPTASTKAVGGCWAITDDDGHFTVMHLSNKEGIPPGQYDVLFSRRVKPDGTPLGETDSPTMVQSEETISKMYSDPAKIGLHNKVDITEKGATSLDFALSSMKMRR